MMRFDQLRESLAAGTPHLIVFGTAWGLAPEIFDGVDATLEPITGNTGYNHLSVRSAVAVILDRMGQIQ